ncbi:hypothetical protein [Kiloniella sp.]|uniref:hypothetical protein n=1 Tax=Kiloniella sp. TaxID=1938587 RepID=UPI003B019848
MEKIQVDEYSLKKKQEKSILQDSFMLRIARGVGEAVSRLVYSPEDLLIHASNKLKLNEYVRKNETSFFGRISNKISGEDPNHITVDGIVITQLHNVLGIDTPNSIEIRYQYSVNHEELRDLYARAKKVIDKNTPEIKIKETLSPPTVKRRR